MYARIRIKKQNERQRIRETRKAHTSKHHRMKIKRVLSKKRKEHMQLLIQHGDARCTLYENYYSRIYYFGKRKSIILHDNIGIELQESIPSFVELAKEIDSSRPQELTFNFTKLSKIYPSTITFLCSFQQMILARTKKTKGRPRIESYYSNNDIGHYLDQSGFNSYVSIRNRNNYIINNKSDNIIKIKHEVARNIEDAQDREYEIMDFIKNKSALTDDDLRWFRNVIIVETMNNVIEHGVPFVDAGWWVMLEHIVDINKISFCIADNGIGIKNSLMTGPQREYIAKEQRKELNGEGDYIKYAMKIEVSGAQTALVKKKKGVWMYKRPLLISGAHRGNGLDWIKRICEKLSIDFSILSNHGYYCYNSTENREYTQSFNFPIFYGTMYNFLIKGK